MPASPTTSTRFDGRVDDYERGRPGYPEALYDRLIELSGIVAGDRVIDLGAGTGLSCAPLLARGFDVVAVEPNAQMRAALARRFAGEPRFRAVDGSAEATGIAAGAGALALAAQAFHWFDPVATRSELRRILRPPARVALVWNARLASGSPFLEAYERLLLTHGTDYGAVGHRGIGSERLTAFFGKAPATAVFDNRQSLDRAGLAARLLSSSYVPKPGAPGHDEMMAELGELFDRSQHGGRVELAYATELHFGALG